MRLKICLYICVLPMRLFLRSLIGPPITWSVHGLSLDPPSPIFFQVEGLIYYLHMWKCHRSQIKAVFFGGGGSSLKEKILNGRGNPPSGKTSWNKKKMPQMGDTLTSQWVQIVALILKNTKIYNKFGLNFILFFSFFFQEGGRGGGGGKLYKIAQERYK